MLDLQPGCKVYDYGVLNGLAAVQARKAANFGGERMKIIGIQSGVRYTLVVALVLLAPVFVAVAATHDDEARTTLRDLGSVNEMKAIFNAGKGNPRLLMLLSPT